MKKYLKIFLMMSLLLVAACSKDDDDNVVVPDDPNGNSAVTPDNKGNSTENQEQNSNNQEQNTEDTPADNPEKTSSPIPSDKKIGLVLGGGGAKGAAEIGVLKVMEANNVKFDYIAGTSIGASVGALYAAGYTAEELEVFMASLTKEDGTDSDRIRAILSKAFEDKGVKTFADLKIPFRCVAADAKTQTEIVLSEGNLLESVMASMAIPVLYKTVEMDDMRLVDGGFLNNLPVDVAKDMGAEYTVVIDLQSAGSMLADALSDEVATLIANPDLAMQLYGEDVINFALYYFTAHPENIKYDINTKAADFYIHPDLTGYDMLSFGKENCDAMVALGVQAAEDALSKKSE
jgi:NTE family protein